MKVSVFSFGRFELRSNYFQINLSKHWRQYQKYVFDFRMKGLSEKKMNTADLLIQTLPNTDHSWMLWIYFKSSVTGTCPTTEIMTSNS